MRRLLQLTWKSGKAYWYQTANFNIAQTTATPLRDGWGATFDNATNTIVLSDGSPTLSFVDPATLALRRSVQAWPPAWPVGFLARGGTGGAAVPPLRDAGRPHGARCGCGYGAV